MCFHLDSDPIAQMLSTSFSLSNIIVIIVARIDKAKKREESSKTDTFPFVIVSLTFEII